MNFFFDFFLQILMNFFLISFEKVVIGRSASGKKKILHSRLCRLCRIFFTTCAGIPMSLYSPMQERYSSMNHYIIS
jgi:hypothetical protein